MRAPTLNSMFDLAILLECQPLPPGRKVGIVTNAGGPGILCADACEANGLEVVELSADTQQALANRLPVEASVTNPVDMIASAGGDDYEQTVAAVLAAPEVDSVIAIFIPVEAEQEAELIASLRRGVRKGRLTGGVGKPVLTVMMREEGISKPIRAEEETLPAYAFPGAAARARPTPSPGRRRRRPGGARQGARVHSWPTHTLAEREACAWRHSNSAGRAG